MATINDVARLAGVGTTTVSKVLAGRPGVSGLTRARVMKAVNDLDFHPSAAGRMLRTGVTRVLGVLTPPPAAHPFSHTFFALLLEGIGEAAARHGYDVLWLTADTLHETGNSHASVFKSRRVDGLIQMHLDVRDPGVELLRNSGYRFVLIGHPEDTQLPHVDPANRDAGKAVARAFLERNFTPVGFLGVAGSPASLDRLAGLQWALAEAGQAIHPSHSVLMHRAEGVDLESFGRQAGREWLRAGCLPRAVMTSTDRIAYGLMSACREARVRVPTQLAVVGVDDEPASRYLDPPLASVQLPIEQLGFEAAELLLQLLAGETPDPAVRILPTRLIERASLG
jgi:DNA-binding LacI/PurR family transcriptional regulator